MASVTETLQPKSGEATASSARIALLALFMVAALTPAFFSVGGLLLSPIRIFLLLSFIPFLYLILSGSVGRVTVVDMLMIAHGFWIVLSLMVVHGAERLAFAGITSVELVGGYFAGRCLIRSEGDYRRFIRLLLAAMVLLFPFALYELFTGKLVIPDLIRHFAGSHSRGDSAYGRLGLERVYGVFEHPILFGLFCSLAVSNAFYLLRESPVGRFVGAGFAVGMAFMSLSSAPLLSCGLQFCLVLWRKVTGGAWITLIILSVVGYVVIDALSNRTPVTILIETLTFNSGTGWTRIAIFESGIAAVIAHPIFGIGFNDWPRPFWLTSSVDNFWLLTSMRYGFVGVGLLVLAFLVHGVRIAVTRLDGASVSDMRAAYLITLVAVCFTLVTVHMWGAASVVVMFYFGAGSWFYTADLSDPRGDEPGVEQVAPSESKPVYTRFRGPAPLAVSRAQEKPRETERTPAYARRDLAQPQRQGPTRTRER